jgi:cephalosporin hydroxylase/predicted 2-oxoglutarate/Fe(II)-dependent dioxygenase YbiX/peroxiredoxin
MKTNFVAPCARARPDRLPDIARILADETAAVSGDEVLSSAPGEVRMSETTDLISGDALKASALRFLTDVRVKVDRDQGGLLSVFDGWFSRVLTKLLSFDRERPWEESVSEYAARIPNQTHDLHWDLRRLRLFLDRWEQGRFVEFSRREQSGAHYHPRFGTEFGADVLLTCQGALSLMRWRGKPLMKNVFDFAMYPALLAELRPRTIFEIGSGSGASAAWFADLLTLGGGDGRVHSVDIVEARMRHPQVQFHQGDCSKPDSLFPLYLLQTAPHPWLVVEDAHHNVSGVLDLLHRFLMPGDYLVVEDSDIKRNAIRAFVDAHPGDYLVDTRFTDNFGRNATCAADSIFMRVGEAATPIASSDQNETSMADNSAIDIQLPLGDPVPWFGAPMLGDGSFNLQVAAGRWIVLAFLGTADGGVEKELDELFGQISFDEDHVIFCGIVTAPPGDWARFTARAGKAVSFVADHDGAISRQFGASDRPRTFVLDPMLRAIANIQREQSGGHIKAVCDVIKSLPDVDNSAGVPLTAPLLIVPRVLDFPLCETLVKVFNEVGGEDSGFLLDIDGKTARTVDHRLKRRNDLVVVHPVLREAMRNQVVRRLVPAIERFFQFKATRLDRYIVSCYDSAVGGHFHRHRDNDNVGAQHRRFAVTINLNRDYEGGDLVFPEFGRRVYRAPMGGAVVFSCGALHQVTPVTKGRRYAFLAFLYGEADAALRAANNAKLHGNAARYMPDSDLLFTGPDTQRRFA